MRTNFQRVSSTPYQSVKNFLSIPPSSVRFRYNSSSASTGTSSTSVPSLPPRPVLDYNSITRNRTSSTKNLIDRKSDLTPDSIEDIAYLYNESKNLNRKLSEAKHRQNLLGNKIKDAVKIIKSMVGPHSKIKDQDNEDGGLDLETKDQIDLLTNNDLKDEEEVFKSNNRKSSSLSSHNGLSNLELAAKVQDYHNEATTLKESINSLTKNSITLEQRLVRLASQIPNITHPDVPIGSYRNSKVTLTSTGSSKGNASLPFYSFEEPCQKPDPRRDHLKIMTDLGWLSFNQGQRTTGPSFPFLIGNGALLELALIQYAISSSIKSGWKLKIGPDLIRSELSDRCGFSPRDQGQTNQTYFVSNQKSPLTQVKTETEEEHQSALNEQLCLSATSEIPMIGSFHSTDFSTKELPIKLVSLGNSYRSEAGSRGLESRGLYRIHQFKKVELISICESDLSESLLKEMVDLQVKILNGLNLPFRILEMSSEELGAPAYHKYDIEAWMPGRGRWGEFTSASNCTDYQSRRLAIRYKTNLTVIKPTNTKDKPTKPYSYVHTLNATGAAIPRLIISLIENGVIFNGETLVGIELPSSLQRFWLGQQPDNQKGFIKWV